MKKHVQSRSAMTFICLLAATWMISCAKNANAESPHQNPAPTKKGVCISRTTWNDADSKFWYQRIRSLNVSWYHTWKAEWDAGNYFLNKEEFVPLLWGKGQADFSTPNGKKAEEEIKWMIQNGKIEYLMGFNEPNHENQADITPEQAIELWPNLMKFNIPLGSPAPAGIVEGSSGAIWLDKFLELAKERNYRVDFICLHLYLGDAEKFKKIVTDAWEKYQLPIWITEFALSDSGASETKPNRFTEDDTIAFLSEVIPWLDSMPFVHRYAWFGSLTDKHITLSSSQLFDQETGALTKVGKFYADYQSVPIQNQ